MRQPSRGVLCVGNTLAIPRAVLQHRPKHIEYSQEAGKEETADEFVQETAEEDDIERTRDRN
jgi:hypothetical protein